MNSRQRRKHNRHWRYTALLPFTHEVGKVLGDTFLQLGKNRFYYDTSIVDKKYMYKVCFVNERDLLMFLLTVDQSIARNIA